MNEQIEKLVGKAWEEADKEVSEKDWHTWVHDGIFQAKLVELVVKECAAQLDDGAEDGMWARGVLYRHFGVEDK